MQHQRRTIAWSALHSNYTCVCDCLQSKLLRMLRAMSQTIPKLRVNEAATVCGGRDSRIRNVRAAVTACSPSPVSQEWDGLTKWRSFIDARRGLNADGKITATVRPFFRTESGSTEDDKYCICSRIMHKAQNICLLTHLVVYCTASGGTSVGHKACRHGAAGYSRRTSCDSFIDRRSS